MTFTLRPRNPCLQSLFDDMIPLRRCNSGSMVRFLFDDAKEAKTADIPNFDTTKFLIYIYIFMKIFNKLTSKQFCGCARPGEGHDFNSVSQRSVASGPGCVVQPGFIRRHPS